MFLHVSGSRCTHAEQAFPVRLREFTDGQPNEGRQLDVGVMRLPQEAWQAMTEAQKTCTSIKLKKVSLNEAYVTWVVPTCITLDHQYSDSDSS